MTAEEKWLPVVGYELLYEVSDLGGVRSLPRREERGNWRKLRVHKPSRLDAWGHLGVKLRKSGVITSRYVHQLVLEAFVGPRPEGMIACHWNDVPDDNRLENLRWATPRENRMDLIRNGHDHNLAKTHCKAGHPYSGDNLIAKGNRRLCATCTKRYQDEYRDRQRAKRENRAA